MSRSNRKISRAFLLVFLVVILVGAITLPNVNADAVVDEPEEETLDMDESVKEEEPVAVEEVKEEPPIVEEKEPEVEEAESEVVEEESVPEVVEEVEEESEPEVVEEVVEESVPEVVEEVEEEEVVETEEETIETTDAAEVTEDSPSRKLSIPFFSKLTKQDAKKIAAFSLGAWGAATGVGWAMQQFGGESD